MRAGWVAIVLSLAACGRKLDEAKAKRMLEAELLRPVETFCCSRIDMSSARASCEAEAEARCGFATGARAETKSYANMGHGDVAMGDFLVRGPKGTGTCAAQFQRADRDWIIVALSCKASKSL